MSAKFKTAIIYGDMNSDSTSDQYPEVTVCAECIEDDKKLGKDQVIVKITGDYDSIHGEECYLCDSPFEED
ncbi:hypothetical protein BRL93_21485 [Xanthomonas oryzae pv. oryzae]|uniref:hypothetical protein n=1 Tax=Xanthomonas oryzae TaxID=347 RepID=UPI0009EC9DAD|nr:hypothetical protein [Xanthomonas oryzae]QBG91692.1 hypothetical protein EYR26_08875 [Xanthomonas oryzae]RBD49883.1 hypothetical protein BRM52_21315 [Xanthomonas oryzae pv. oryzae]RBH86467.1 hypothetical protein BRL93_21485 [Xanthomonas oryzae pv. oryzae]WEE87265.1 hypothetical protein MJJ06_03225 [Xanthomonas oryzae]